MCLVLATSSIYLPMNGLITEQNTSLRVYIFWQHLSISSYSQNNKIVSKSWGTLWERGNTVHAEGNGTKNDTN